MAYKGGGSYRSKGEADARPPVVVIVSDTGALNCPETELGLNVHAVPTGKPLQLKLVALGSGALTRKKKLAELPAITLAPPLRTKNETGGPTWAVSVDVSFEVMISPPPETVTVLVTELGALFATLTVSVIAG